MIRPPEICPPVTRPRVCSGRPSKIPWATATNIRLAPCGPATEQRVPGLWHCRHGAFFCQNS
eukprot:10535134-Alexandrium_andersonii.AAC.1